MTIMDLGTPEAVSQTELYWESFMDGSLFLIHSVALAALLARPWSRARLIGGMMWVAVLSAAAIVIATPFIDNSALISAAKPGVPGWSAFTQQLVCLFSLFLVHFVASMFMALSAREGLFLLLGMMAVFSVGALTHEGLNPAARAIAIALFPFAGLPGFIWAWVRYQGFTDRLVSREISARYGELSDELADARRVHEALFPPPISRGSMRLSYKYEPMRDIGGDFLFVRPLSFPPAASAEPLSVVLIDVTGHGVAAALAVNRLYVELTRIFASTPMPHPQAVISQLNEFCHQVMAPQGVFATAICLQADPGAGVIRWSSAGHPPALLRRPGGDVMRLDSGATMLGVLAPEEFDANECMTPFTHGDRVLAYTDGLSEAVSARGEELGISGVQGLVSGVRGGEHGAIAASVSEALAAFRHGPPRDDILMVELALADPPCPESPHITQTNNPDRVKGPKSRFVQPT